MEPKNQIKNPEMNDHYILHIVYFSLDITHLKFSGEKFIVCRGILLQSISLKNVDNHSTFLKFIKPIEVVVSSRFLS